MCTHRGRRTRRVRHAHAGAAYTARPLSALRCPSCATGSGAAPVPRRVAALPRGRWTLCYEWAPTVSCRVLGQSWMGKLFVDEHENLPAIIYLPILDCVTAETRDVWNHVARKWKVVDLNAAAECRSCGYRSQSNGGCFPNPLGRKFGHPHAHRSDGVTIYRHSAG